MVQELHGEGNLDSEAELGVLFHRIISDRHNLPFHKSMREDYNDTSGKLPRQGKPIPLVEDGVQGYPATFMNSLRRLKYADGIDSTYSSPFDFFITKRYRTLFCCENCFTISTNLSMRSLRV